MPERIYMQRLSSSSFNPTKIVPKIQLTWTNDMTVCGLHKNLFLKSEMIIYLQVNTKIYGEEFYHDAIRTPEKDSGLFK